MEKWKCTVCGYIHEGPMTEDFRCPVCKVPASKFVKIEVAPKNPYAGTQTEQNLLAAFAGESQARNKYTYFASAAKKEGYEQISALFLKTAENEKEHAKLWLKELKGIGNTAENLAAAADGENYEWTDMYEGFAKSEVKVWECRNCGHIVVGTKAPEICPVCAHPQSYFEISAENY